jgi:hypothetical protein
VHDTDLHGGSHITCMSKWLTVLLRLCGSCRSWREGRHGGVLCSMSLSISSSCVPLYLVARSNEYISKVQASLSPKNNASQHVLVYK